LVLGKRRQEDHKFELEANLGKVREPYLKNKLQKKGFEWERG
jgi:hypothetical protein